MTTQILCGALHVGSCQFLCQNSRSIEELQLIVNSCCLVASIASIANDMETHTRFSGDLFTAKTASKMSVDAVKFAKFKFIDSSYSLLGREITRPQPQTVLVLQVGSPSNLRALHACGCSV